MRRRRVLLAWGGALLVAAAGVTALVVLMPAPESEDIAPRSNEPAQQYREPPAVPFTAERRRAIERVLVEFTRTAAARRDVGRSFDLVTSELRGGLSRREWANGDIPVYPFPGRDAKVLHVVGSYRRSVLLDISIVPRPESKYQVSDFSVELRAVGRGERRRWLVHSFLPLRIVDKQPAAAEAAPAEEPSRQAEARAEQPGPASGRGRLDTRWLLLPVAFLALIVLTPLALGIKEWWQARRVEARG